MIRFRVRLRECSLHRCYVFALTKVQLQQSNIKYQSINIKDYQYIKDQRKMDKEGHNLNEFRDYLINNYPESTVKINLGSEYQIPVGQKGIALLVDYLTWNIEHLNITMHRVENQGLQILINKQQAEDKVWTNLKQFASIKNNITSEGLFGLQLVNWHQLEGFNFTQNKIDHRGVDILIKCQFSQSLKRLSLGNNNIGVEGCEILNRSKWPNFQRLHLNYNLITNEGLAYLQLADWPNLLEANLSNNKLDSTGMIYLQKANWPLLQILNLSRNNIGKANESQLTDMGCLRLSKMKTKSLKRFGIYGNQICLGGLLIIFRSKVLVEQCFLELTKNNFTFSQVKPFLLQYDVFCNQFED